MAFLKQIVIDCEHPASLARFWSAALDNFEIRPYDDEEFARLATLGFTPETDPVVLVDGPGIEICFQKVPLEASLEKRRLHLDIASDDLEGEVLRLVDLGASQVEKFNDHAWMRDLEGNDFCVTKA
jgi:Glyoxalase-like domain